MGMTGLHKFITAWPCAAFDPSCLAGLEWERSVAAVTRASLSIFLHVELGCPHQRQEAVPALEEGELFLF